MLNELPRFPEASPDAASLPPEPGKSASPVKLLQFAIGTALANAVLAAALWGMDVKQMVVYEAVLFFAVFGLFGLGNIKDEQVVVIWPQLGLVCGLIAGLLAGAGLAYGLTYFETRGGPLSGAVDGIVAAVAFGALLGVLAGGAVTLLGGQVDVWPGKYLVALGRQPLWAIRRALFGARLKKEIRLPGQPWVEAGVWLALVVGPVLWFWLPNPERQVCRLHGHRGPVRCVAFSPDGKWALSGGNDTTVRLWDVESGRELRHFEGHEDPVNGVAFAPDGRHAISGSGFARSGGYVRDGGLRLWDMFEGKLVRRFEEQPGVITAVAFRTDGQQALSAGEDGNVRLWNVGSGQQLHRLGGGALLVTTVGLSTDGRWVVIGMEDRRWMMFATVDSGRPVLLGSLLPRITAAALSPGSRHLLCGNEKGTVALWDLETDKEERQLAGVVLPWDRGVELWYSTRHADAVRCLAFSPDGRRALSGGGRDGSSWWPQSADNSVRLWDVTTGNELARLKGHTAAVRAVAFTPDGRRALSCSDDGTVRLWSLPE